MGKKLALLLLVLVVMSTEKTTAADIEVLVGGEKLPAVVQEGTTYVPLRSLMEHMGDWDVTWREGEATAASALVTLTFPIGKEAIYADGFLYESGASFLHSGRTWVPLRATAELCGAAVYWRGWQEPIEVVPSGGVMPREDELYWLSRIISAESRGESLLGQLAVGSVVLNRAEHPDYPNTIYSVIFEYNFDYQFEPVENGTVYQTPTEQSLLAAKLCLNGTRVLEDCLYFFNPDLAAGTWIRENRDYYTTIGCHRFYQ